MAANLRANYDSLVVTGPTGASFWSAVSPEVFVRVEPDGYDYTYRTTDLREWSYRAVGLSDAEVKSLLSYSSPPTKRHRLYGSYVHAGDLERRLRSLLEHSSAAPRHQAGPQVEVVTDYAAQSELLQNLHHERELIALDYEWVIGSNALIGLNVSTSDRNFYLPVLGKDFNQSFYQDAIRAQVLGLCKNVPTVWHNAKADIKAQYAGDPLDWYGYPIEDTILMAYVAGYSDLGLKGLSEAVLGRKAVPLPSDLSVLPIEVAARYGAAGDTRNTLGLYYKLKRKLEETNQYHIYNDIERPLVPMVASMEWGGSPLDMKEIQRLRDEFYAHEQAIRQQILDEHGLDFNKDDEQRAYLHKFGFNTSSLDKRVLSRVTADWIIPLLDFREFRTTRRNFLDKTLSQRGAARLSDSARAYPTFNQAGRDTETGSWKNAPATGRMSSAGPNFQNQPRSIRSAFVAPGGYKLVSLDYSALELRIAAAISEDPVMLSVLQAGGDIHQHMREVIQQETGVDVGRPTAKTANFNLRYGGQADMLMTISAKQRAHLSYEMAKAIVDADRKTYAGYWQWFDRTVREARRNGYSETLDGRRRYIGDLSSTDELRRGNAERAAANMVIQGTAADIVKRAMAHVVPLLRHYAAHLSIQVHDELVFWCPEDVAEAFVRDAKDVMASIPLPHLKLVVEGGAGNNWAEAH